MRSMHDLASDMTISTCLPSEYAELVQFLNDAFEKNEKQWFLKYYCHIFHNDPRLIACNNLVRINGQLVGAIGVYPIGLRIGNARLSVGGVGSVSTRKELRGKGVMSYMLEHVIRQMQEQKFDISWLSGGRFRYSNYGWQKGGRHYSFTIHRPDIERIYPKLPPIKIARVTSKDIPVVSRLYSKYKVGAVRSAEDWQWRLKRKGFDTYLAQSDMGAAYLTVERRKWAGVVEIQGNTKIALALLVKYLKRNNEHMCRVSYPCWPDSLGGTLSSVADDFSIIHRHQLRIVTPETTWAKLLPEIEKSHAPVAPSLLKKLGKVKSPEDQRALLTRALGFFEALPLLPKHLHEFEWIRPLPWWISDFDSV